ncbi:MAG: redox-sensitive bicupin YhaK (pirin superfamily) [Candidatus Poriferisodalaceae bacterium]|jgi:quercetin 2,3-dioxygenase
MSVIKQRLELGAGPWPTLDPFLFCVHHLDHYPSGNGAYGPDRALLQGRQIGQDFANVDGWNMYHGDVVPGFPQHPHRGFETITFTRRGLVDHADSMGATARYGRGDVQWMTAGKGIVHAEMFPLLDEDEPNSLELFQIWINLPPVSKMVEPHFTMFWEHDIPHLESDGVNVTVIAGKLADHQPPSPPPASWAAQQAADVAIWHVSLQPGASWTIPVAAFEDTSRVLYLFEGDHLVVEDEHVDSYSGAALATDQEVTVTASESGAEFVILQGRPIGEPVAQYGPFVMNTEAEIHQAFADYRATQFGGWPWEDDGPVHGDGQDRFARHADGTTESVDHVPS